MPHLVIQKGPHRGQSVPLLRAKTVLGRYWTCDVVLDSPDDANQKNAVSRRHAIITCDNGEYYIEDGNGRGRPSHNHTIVNGIQLPFPGRTLLKTDDTIKICDYLFTFHAVEPSMENESSSSFEASINHDSSNLLTQTADRLKLLLEISNRLSHSLELDVLLPQVVENLLQLYKKADRGFLILVDEATDGLVLQSHKARGPKPEAQAGYSVSIVKECLKKVKGILSNNVKDDFPGSDSVAGLAIRSVMCAPLWSLAGKAFGVLLLDSQDAKKEFTQEDLNFLMGVASQASIALVNARFHREALARERHKRDLSLAREVVKSFLPARLPKIPAYEFFAFNESALEVGGDYYDLLELAGNRLGILVGDVAGKGVAAALVMARFSAEARACLRTETDLAGAVRRLNDLMQPLNLTDRFVTLVALLLDPATHTLTLVNAGLPPPLLVRRATGVIEEAVSRNNSGPPLGVMDGYAFEACQITLEAGDSLVLFSDGVTEAQDVQRRQFGTKGVRAVVQRGSAPPRELGERILRAVKDHAAGCPQYDDITLVCFGLRA